MDNRNYSQITFEFSDAATSSENEASVGIRVKSLKSETEPVKPEVPETVLAEPEKEAVIPPVVVKKSTRGRKSLKALDAEADLVNIPDDETLFQRQYYSIGEVADMFGVNQSLLRFWENEFDIIQPRKNRKGDRHFRPIDIKNLELIYDLLRRRKLTIEGAKDFLKKNSKATAHFEMIQSLQSLKGFLLEIKAAL
jgi:DNA-binding transcriptional MerR regulator